MAPSYSYHVWLTAGSQEQKLALSNQPRPTCCSPRPSYQTKRSALCHCLRRLAITRALACIGAIA